MARDKPLTEQSKWFISSIAALIFMVVASPFMFTLTEQIINRLGLEIETITNGCPNLNGLLIHTVVFAILIRISMVIPIPGRY